LNISYKNHKNQNNQIISDALFDVGSGPSCITKNTILNLGLVSDIMPIKGAKSILQGDGSIMTGCIGTIQLKVGLIDTVKYTTPHCLQLFYVFDKLNHNIIIGRNLIKKCTKKYVIFPSINVILFNPSLKQFRHYNKIENSSMSLNNTENETNQCFKNNNNLLINIPGTTLDTNNLDNFYENGILEYVTCDFVNNIENIISENGEFDEYIDKTRSIECPDFNELDTKFGKVRIGKTMSPEMQTTFKNYFNDYKGQLFNATSLGKTKQEAHLTLKPNVEVASMSSPKYIPLNPTMQ